MRKLFVLLLIFGFSSLSWAEYVEGVEYELLEKALGFYVQNKLGL